VSNTVNASETQRSRLSVYRPQDWPEMLTVTQVAQLLHVAPPVVRREIKNGRISATTIGGEFRIASAGVWEVAGRIPAIRAQWPAGPWRQTEQG